MEISTMTEARKAMRERVREMEAFGWALDDFEDIENKRVRLRFLRPSDIADKQKLRKVELAFSRLPVEESALTAKVLAGLMLAILVSIVAGFAVAVYIGMEVFLVLNLLIITIWNSGAKKLTRRREMLLDRARELTGQRGWKEDIEVKR